MSNVPAQVRKISMADSEAWIQVGDRAIFVRDDIDEAREPAARMTVGFARLVRGESMDITFPYDEVLVVTSGTYTVSTADGRALTAQAGEAIFLPAGSVNTSRADEDTEMVYVAAPPSVYAEHVRASAAG